MTVKADPVYLKRHDNSVEGVNYKSVTPDFSGYILFHNWEEQFLVGYRYENGKISDVVRAKGFLVNGRTVSQDAQADQSCNTYQIDTYCQDCTDWYTNGEYQYTICEPAYVCNSQVVTVCSQNDSGTGGTGGGYATWTSGGPTDPGVPPLCETNLFHFYKGSTDSWTGAITGLGFMVKNNSTGAYFTFNFQKYCVSIPAYNVGESAASEEIFRNAFNQAAKAVAAQLSGAPLNSRLLFKTCLEPIWHFF